MIARRLVIWYAFLFALCIGVWYISWLQGIPKLLWSLVLYSVIAYILGSIWCMIRWKRRSNFTEFFIIFLYKVSIYVSIMLLLIGYFIVHQTHVFPAKMPSHTLSNGEKTVIFQAMSHIGSPIFYEKVRENIWKAKTGWYVLYYEWVGSGSPENKKAFDEALGIELNPDSYEMLAKLYWVVAQDNNSLLWIVNNKDYNVDLNLDEIMTLYRDKAQVSPDKKSLNKSPSKVYNIENDIIWKLSKLNTRQMFLLRYFNQAIMNFMMKHESLRENILKLSGKQDIFSVILEDRNKHLAKKILQSDDTKIITTYGLMHFTWVLKLLQSVDPKWKIIETNYEQVIYPARESSS